jgi:4-amino-4-deoxy-L-arabinose transferase-like glycosyltransferase
MGAAETSTKLQTASSGASTPIDTTWFALLLLIGVTVAVRLVGIDRLPSTDELYTVLAARGWADEGLPQIGEGIYSRAELFTVAVGSLFRIFGDSVEVARMLSVVAGSILVAGVFVWTRSVAGSLAAWIAAGLLCFSPLHILTSQFARFYALMGLLLWLGSVGIYMLMHRRLSTRTTLVLTLGSGLCLLLALYLQVLAAMGIVGLSLWLAYAAGLPWLRARREQPRRLLIGLTLAGVLAIVVLGIATETGVVEQLWHRYRWSPLWSIEHKNDFWFYQVWFTQHYQSLWPILPFLVILAAARQPKPAIFCLFVFVTGFVLLSFGGMKDRRYISFLLPFLFVLWGIALAELGPLLVRCVAKATPRALRNLDPSLQNRLARATVIGLGVLFLIASNGAPAKTLFKLAGVRLIADDGSAEITTSASRGDWHAVKAPLAPWLRDASIVLTSDDVETIHGVGRYDMALNANRITEITGSLSGGEGEFEIDPRTGRPVISTADSLRLVMSCYPDGLILAGAGRFRSDEAIIDPVADVIEADTVPIALPSEARILAFHWQHPVPDPPPAACATLPKIKGRPSPT